MNIIVIIFMVLIVSVLVAGIVVMMRGGELNKKYGNRLMVARVGLQGAIILLLGLMFMMAGK